MYSVSLPPRRSERFNKLPEAISEVPSVDAHLWTFLAGARGCIDWRIAVLECVSWLLECYLHASFPLTRFKTLF